jgi:glucose-1-phosphatase
VPAPDILLFDLGGVLIRSTHFEALRELMRFDGPEQELRERWMACPAVRAFEGGRISATDFGASIVEALRLSVTPDEFLSAFATWPQGFYEGAGELVAKLRKSYRVGCLSNSNSLHWTAEIEATFDFAYSSHLTGHLKPDAAAFDHVVSAQRARPQAMVFFDDSLVNVHSARKAGMVAHHTMGFTELLQVLEASGVVDRAR